MAGTLTSKLNRSRLRPRPGRPPRNGGASGAAAEQLAATTCFLRGTRIRAADGYRPVESLAVGDPVATRFAGVAPIKFIESFTLERAGRRREWLGHFRPVTVRRAGRRLAVRVADRSVRRDLRADAELRRRLRRGPLAAVLVIDRRQSIDLIRDAIEERGLALSRAA
jgi:hypothetical protein